MPEKHNDRHVASKSKADPHIRSSMLMSVTKLIVNEFMVAINVLGPQYKILLGEGSVKVKNFMK